MLTFQGTGVRSVVRHALGARAGALAGTCCRSPRGRRSPGQEEGSNPSALGGTRSQEILETLEQSKTNIRELPQESGKEHENIRKELPVLFRCLKEDLGKTWRVGKDMSWDWSSWCSVAEEEEDSWAAQAGGRGHLRAGGMLWKGGIRATDGQRGGTRQVHHPCHQKVTSRAGSPQINPAPNQFSACLLLLPTLHSLHPAHAWLQQSHSAHGLSVFLPVPWCTPVPRGLCKHHRRIWEMIKNNGKKNQAKKHRHPHKVQATKKGDTETANSLSKFSLVFISL